MTQIYNTQNKSKKLNNSQGHQENESLDFYLRPHTDHNIKVMAKKNLTP